LTGKDLAAPKFCQLWFLMALKDRTAEFNAIAETIRKSHAVKTRPRPKASLFQQRISINKLASEIGKQTYETTQRLAELTRLAKSQSLFNDPAEKIQELVVLIKQDIQFLDKKIKELEHLVKNQKHENEQTGTHSETIVEALKSNLILTTNSFKKVLEIRTENLKAQQERRERFTGTRRTLSTSLTQQPLPNPLLFSADENSSGVKVSEDGEVGITLPMVQVQDSLIEQRSSAVKAIEQTITELQGIFQHLALLVHEQDLQIRRIDENVENAALHVEGAHKQLVTYLQKVSSNRALILKVFGVLFVFIVLFVIFFA
jgi:syntaxin 5